MVSIKIRKLFLLIANRIYPVKSEPIFIFGNQKSGTTVIAALLAQYANISVTLDIPGMYEPTQTKLHLGKLPFDDFVNSNKIDFSRDIIKEPSLTFLYEDLKKFFPKSKCVLVVRDPRDNIRSILNRLSIPGNQEDLSSETYEKLSPEWKLVVNGKWMGLKGNTYIEQLSNRWVKSVGLYFNNYNDITVIKYEDFCDDKVSAIGNLANVLGLLRVKSISKSVDKQFQPRGNRNVEWDEFFGERNLNRIEEVCGDYMKEFGYESIFGK